MDNKLLAAVAAALILAGLAVAAYTGSENTGPDTGRGANATENSAPGSEAPVYVEDLILPPYLELRYLWKDFPVVVRSSKPIHTDQAKFLAIANGSIIGEARIVSSSLAENNGSYYLVARIVLPHGYYEPGNLTIALQLPDGRVGENLTILGPPVYEDSPPGYTSRERDSIVYVWPENAGTPIDAFVADCPPGSYAVMITSSSVELRLGDECPASEAHTLVVQSAAPEGIVFYVIKAP